MIYANFAIQYALLISRTASKVQSTYAAQRIYRGGQVTLADRLALTSMICKDFPVAVVLSYLRKQGIRVVCFPRKCIRKPVEDSIDAVDLRNEKTRMSPEYSVCRNVRACKL